MDNRTLYTKLVTLPDDLKAEVSDFVDSLLLKLQKTERGKKPKFGSGKDMFVLKNNFDEPLNDFKEYMH